MTESVIETIWWNPYKKFTSRRARGRQGQGRAWGEYERYTHCNFFLFLFLHDRVESITAIIWSNLYKKFTFRRARVGRVQGRAWGVVHKVHNICIFFICSWQSLSIGQGIGRGRGWPGGSTKYTPSVNFRYFYFSMTESVMAIIW